MRANLAGVVAVCLGLFIFQSCAEYAPHDLDGGNECTPDCTGKCCGDDGCGGTCPDNCPDTGRTCSAQTCECEGACQPNCQGRECGPDECGSTCQPGCGAGEQCNETTGQCESITFKAYIQHFGGDDLVSGMEVRAIDNATGQELGINETSDASGWVSFRGLPAGNVGFRCVGVLGDWVDTYQFKIDSTAQDVRLWAVDHTTYTGVPLIAGITVIEGKAIVSGAVYWVNAADEEEPVGCATVASNPASDDVRYMGENGMPTTIESQPDTHPLWGRYVVANIDPGQATITASVDSTAIGNTQLFTYADSITISDIYSETGTNPTPAGCQYRSSARIRRCSVTEGK